METSFEQQVEAALFAATDPLTETHPFDISLARHIRKLAPPKLAEQTSGFSMTLTVETT